MCKRASRSCKRGGGQEQGEQDEDDGDENDKEDEQDEDDEQNGQEENEDGEEDTDDVKASSTAKAPWTWRIVPPSQHMPACAC